MIRPQEEALSAPSDALTDAPDLEMPAVAEEDLLEESLVEEVSIDGMCGVY
jgi:mycofactocin precursor peptide MftA